MGNGIMICYKIVRIVGDEVTTRSFMIESQADEVYNDWLEKGGYDFVSKETFRLEV